MTPVRRSTASIARPIDAPGERMNQNKNARLTGLSQTLRKNMTPEERHLWYDFLKKLPQTVQRQKVIGRYIADFYIAEAHAIIELDGAQHYEEENRNADRIRDEFMYARGIDVWRYTNRDIHTRFQDICKDISMRIERAVKEKR